MPAKEVHRTALDAAPHDVSEVLRFDREFLDGLYRGVAEPDKMLDRTSHGHPVKHHVENKVLIDYYYLLSLYHYRRGDPYTAGICLGRALHYIHDNAIAYCEEAEHVRIEHDMRELAKGEANMKRLCNTSSAIVKHKAVEALCTAYRKSIDTLKSFAEEVYKPIDVEKVRKRYRRARLIKVLASAALFTLSLFTMYMSLFIIHEIELGIELGFALLSLYMIIAILVAPLPTLYMASRTGRFKLRRSTPLAIASLIPPHFIALLLLALLIIFSYIPDAYIDAMKAGVAKTSGVTNIRTAY
jgi:hypothetical protein